MGPRVPIRWTTLREACTMFVRDSTFIKSQIQALRQVILEKPSWKAYCEEGALIMAALIHDKMYNPYSNPPVTCAQEAVGARKERLKAPSTVCSSKEILPLLAKAGASSKKSKGKKVVDGEGSSLDCYTAKYMKALYTLPNGLSIEEGHLWNKRMETFHAGHPVFSAEEGRKHPTIDPLDAFALSTLYMIKTHHLKRCKRSLEVAQISLKEKEEELNSAKEALFGEKLKCKQIQEEKQAAELNHAKKYITLEAEMLKVKSHHSSLAKDMEDSRSARLEAIKRAEVAEARSYKAENRLICGQVHRRLPSVGRYVQPIKKEWPEEYFEGISVSSPIENVEAPGEQMAAPCEVVEGEVVDDEVIV
ncbi:hypothetical protein LIER_35504 [Lithospermum erythrorhizon]|uniref:Uncharacterized protein n=1 Tax=Lithospermum erythrorhizon TaxID=34254 RepID=A0AAV3NSF0_LITER